MLVKLIQCAGMNELNSERFEFQLLLVNNFFDDQQNISFVSFAFVAVRQPNQMIIC